jgi:glutathione S-transferase
MLASRESARQSNHMSRAVGIRRESEISRVGITSKFTVPIFWRVTRVPPSRRDWDSIAQAVAALDTVLDIAEAQLGRSEFLAANDFTLADIQFGHVLYRYFDIPIVRPDRPNLRRYYDALTTRPAYREHVMVSYEELQVAD